MTFFHYLITLACLDCSKWVALFSVLILMHAHYGCAIPKTPFQDRVFLSSPLLPLPHKHIHAHAHEHRCLSLFLFECNWIKSFHECAIINSPFSILDVLSRLGVFAMDGNAEFRTQLDYVVTPTTVGSFVVLVVLDMSKPWNLGRSLERWLQILSDHLLSLNAPDLDDLKGKCNYALYT